MKIWVKIHEHEQGKVIAVCDNEVLGKIYEEDIKVLNVTENFYKGKKMSVNEFIKLIEGEDFNSVNIVGNRIIEELINLKIITNFKIIRGVKYAHIYKVKG